MHKSVKEELEQIISCGIGRSSFSGLVEQLNAYLRELSPERRRQQRLSVLLDVRWRGASVGCSFARMYNLSASGCLIVSGRHVPSSEIVDFDIRLPDGRWLPLSGKFTRHCNGVSFGVHFQNLSEQARLEIERLLTPITSKSLME